MHKGGINDNLVQVLRPQKKTQTCSFKSFKTAKFLVKLSNTSQTVS